MGAEGGGWGREAGGEVACEEEREGGRREGGAEVGRGGYKCGGRGKAREGHEETSLEVACSEDVRLEVRVLHDLHREVIGRQTRTKRLSARHCAARVSGLHASDICRRLTLHTLKKGLVRNPRESLLPGCQLRLLLPCQRRHNPRADHRLFLRHLHLHPRGNLVERQWRGRRSSCEKAFDYVLKTAQIHPHFASAARSSVSTIATVPSASPTCMTESSA